MGSIIKIAIGVCLGIFLFIFSCAYMCANIDTEMSKNTKTSKNVEIDSAYPTGSSNTWNQCHGNCGRQYYSTWTLDHDGLTPDERHEAYNKCYDECYD